MHGGGFEVRGEAAATAIRQRQARFIGAAIVATVLVMMMLRPGSGTGRFSGEVRCYGVQGVSGMLDASLNTTAPSLVCSNPWVAECWCVR